MLDENVVFAGADEGFAEDFLGGVETDYLDVLAQELGVRVHDVFAGGIGDAEEQDVGLFCGALIGDEVEAIRAMLLYLPKLRARHDGAGEDNLVRGTVGDADGGGLARGGGEGQGGDDED